MTVSREEHFRVLLDNSKQQYHHLTEILNSFRADVTSKLDNLSKEIHHHDRKIYKIEHDVKNLKLTSDFRATKISENQTALEDKIDVLHKSLEDEKKIIHQVFYKAFFIFSSSLTALFGFLAYLFETYFEVNVK